MKTREEIIKKAQELLACGALSKDACEAIKNDFPELAESEDEMIRKALYELVSNDKAHGYTEFYEKKGITCDDVIAYLEKQKEQQPLSTEETELNSIAFLEQMGYTCIPPKKEHQNNSDAPKNALGGALNSPLDKDKNLDDIAQDYVEAVKEYNPELTWDLMQTAVCYGYHYREEEEQKPNIELIQRSWYMEGYTDGEFKREPMWNLVTGKSGPRYEKNEKYGQPLEQKPAEWSEEDKLPIDAAIYWLEKRLEDEKAYDISTRSYPLSIRETVERLKSLRPSFKDKEMKLKILKYLSTRCSSLEFEEVEDYLNNLRPQPHWKPSEEQMNELLNAVSRIATPNKVILDELYRDLKKLM